MSLPTKQERLLIQSVVFKPTSNQTIDVFSLVFKYCPKDLSAMYDAARRSGNADAIGRTWRNCLWYVAEMPTCD